MKKVIAASRNKHKIQEIEKITEQFGFSIISRDDAQIPPVEVIEDGDTFQENSYIKAKAILDIAQQPTIADDSGLVVDYLDGAPGVYSARFAGEDADDEKNLDKLIEMMEGVPYEKRTAAFVCCITFLFPEGKKIVAEGRCEGHIVEKRRGNNGFGYDPVFVPLGYDRTFGELDEEIKNNISHRAQALKKLQHMLIESNM